MLCQALHISLMPCGPGPRVRPSALGKTLGLVATPATAVSVRQEGPVRTGAWAVGSWGSGPTMPPAASGSRHWAAHVGFLTTWIVRKFLCEPLCIPLTLTHGFKFYLLSILTFPHGNSSESWRQWLIYLLSPSPPSLPSFKPNTIFLQTVPHSEVTLSRWWAPVCWFSFWIY